MNRWLSGFLLGISLLSCEVRAREAITWLKWDFHPDYIKDGPYKGQGYADRYLTFLQRQLPEYDHRSTFVNMNRLIVHLKEDTHCTAMLWFGYLPGEIIYSRAFSFTPPYGIYTTREKAASIGAVNQSVSLRTLLDTPSLRLGLLGLYGDVANRTNPRYPILHTIIAPYLGSGHVIEIKNTRNQISLDILTKGRVDYIITNPMTVPAQVKTYGLGGDFVFFNIEEAPHYKKVATACSANDTGNVVIGKINQLVTRETIMMFLEYQEEWNGKDSLFRQKTIDYFVNGNTDDPYVID